MDPAQKSLQDQGHPGQNGEISFVTKTLGGKEEYRQKVELRRKEKKEKAAEREKKKREREEALRGKGEKKTKNQPKISIWFRKKDAERRGQPVGGRQGVG